MRLFRRRSPIGPVAFQQQERNTHAQMLALRAMLAEDQGDASQANRLADQATWFAQQTKDHQNDADDDVPRVRESPRQDDETK